MHSVRKTYDPAPTEFKLDVYDPMNVAFTMDRPLTWGDMMYLFIRKSEAGRVPTSIMKVCAKSFMDSPDDI